MSARKIMQNSLNTIVLKGAHRNGNSPSDAIISPLIMQAPTITLLEIAEFREQLQPVLDKFIAAKTARYLDATEDPLLRAIWEYPRRLVAARGKRLRPYAAYLMHHALSEEDTSNITPGVLHVLMALELFHLFCLIHDDIIDQGRERHSLPTAQQFVMEKLRAENRLRDHSHIGNAQAMLLGDMFFAWSHEAFHAHGPLNADALHYFQWMIDEVVIGEMMDVDMTTCRTTSGTAIHQKMLLKTASYTFIRPFQIGAALAGQGAAMENFCRDFGLSLGIAFQVQDDLMDLIGTTSDTRKTALSDLREGQHTYFTQHIFENGTPAQQNELRALMGRDLGEKDRSRVLELFESSGAFARGQEIIRRHLDAACKRLEHAPARLKQRAAFCDLVHAITSRSF
jgi:geranylgeranyl diphosphate synthase type I